MWGAPPWDQGGCAGWLTSTAPRLPEQDCDGLFPDCRHVWMFKGVTLPALTTEMLLPPNTRLEAAIDKQRSGGRAMTLHATKPPVGKGLVQMLHTLSMASQRVSLSLFGKSITGLALPSQMQAASCTIALASLISWTGHATSCHGLCHQTSHIWPLPVLIQGATFIELKWFAFRPSMPSHRSRTSAGKDL